MAQNLNNFLKESDTKKYATQKGTRIHALLKNIVIDSINGDFGNQDIILKIKKHPELCKYFSATSKTEVPIAGYINGVFLSRRIDRLLIDDATKTVYFIDYKTDTNKTIFFDKYKKQLSEYAQLLQSAYGNYKIVGYILWLNDWILEQIITL